jgi:3'-phosphoadenosine 5'-phosphosulfate sulfotransferase (PAPS reductase)/FAD synthetase
MTQRIVCWFSCGAASAVATKLAIEENKRGKNLPLVVVRSWIKEEHPDNDRFAADCEKWFGVPILTLKNEKYSGSIMEVFASQRFIKGPHGAPCTKLLKKEVTNGFLQYGDLQVWGFSVEEQERLDRIIDANADFRIWPILIEKGLAHADTLAIIQRAGIELPVMYKMGYTHNNCIGCVKAGNGYWNKIRVDFPAEFERMAVLEERLGAKILKLKDERISLRQLPPDSGDYQKEPSIQCGIFCELAEREMAA